MKKEIIPHINKDFMLAIPSTSSLDELEALLAARINYLIINDFPALVHILYRIDVNEKKLDQLLKLNPETDAGKLLAALVIERQLAKIRSRQQYGRDENNASEEERW